MGILDLGIRYRVPLRGQGVDPGGGPGPSKSLCIEGLEGMGGSRVGPVRRTSGQGTLWTSGVTLCNSSVTQT